VTDGHGQTALMVAADQGHGDTVKLLLQRQASLDLQNRRGATALMLACFNGHLDVVTELLRAGADVNAKSKNKHTALMLAAVKQNETAVQIINLLLDQKADINAQDEEGYTALMRAVNCPPPPPGPLSQKAKDLKEYDKNDQVHPYLLQPARASKQNTVELSIFCYAYRNIFKEEFINRQISIVEKGRHWASTGSEDCWLSRFHV
jgi:Ankyrin repeats (3 copies)/Ankyrin repeat